MEIYRLAKHCRVNYHVLNSHKLSPNGVVGHLFLTFKLGLNELGLRLVELLDLSVGGERL